MNLELRVETGGGFVGDESRRPESIGRRLIHGIEGRPYVLGPKGRNLTAQAHQLERSLGSGCQVVEASHFPWVCTC